MRLLCRALLLRLTHTQGATVTSATVTVKIPKGSESDLASYQLFRNGSPVGSAVMVGGLPTGTEVQLSDVVSASGSYDYTVAASDTVGNVSPPSDPVTVPIDLTAPAKPIGLSLKTVVYA